ncbi:MAG: hypothetical protein WD626_05295 [Bauldia sp.]
MTMTMQVAENAWGSILHHRNRGIVELVWTKTAEMGDGGFMATLCLLAGEAERVRAPFILVDAVAFRHTFGPNVNEWRQANVIPRYGAAGVRRFAFIMPEGFAHIGEEAVEGHATFPTAWFGSRHDALAWLASA